MIVKACWLLLLHVKTPRQQSSKQFCTAARQNNGRCAITRSDLNAQLRHEGSRQADYESASKQQEAALALSCRAFLGSAPAAAFLTPVARLSGWTAIPNQHLFRRWHNAGHFALFRSIFSAASGFASSRRQTPECQQPGAAKAAPAQRINSRRHWLLHASGWRRHLCRGWHVPARVTPHAAAAAARAAVPLSAAPGARRGKFVNQAPCRIISCRATNMFG